jgi:hypothetical protein
MASISGADAALLLFLERHWTHPAPSLALPLSG